MLAGEHVSQVEIFGERYTLRATEDPAYIRRVAQYVDTKLYEVAKGGPAIPSLRMAVLASLNIADELFKLGEARERETASALAKIAELTRSLDQVISARG
jgi:cell division protein ZapA